LISGVKIVIVKRPAMMLETAVLESHP